MDSVIEVQRQTHEEIERLERAAATLLSQPLTTVRPMFRLLDANAFAERGVGRTRPFL